MPFSEGWSKENLNENYEDSTGGLSDFQCYGKHSPVELKALSEPKYENSIPNVVSSFLLLTLVSQVQVAGRVAVLQWSALINGKYKQAS